MAKVTVDDGELPLDEDTTLPVKIITAVSMDGMTSQIMIPVDAAAELGKLLIGDSGPDLQIASPADLDGLPNPGRP